MNQKPANSSVPITYAYLPKDGSLVIYSGIRAKIKMPKHSGRYRSRLAITATSR